MKLELNKLVTLDDVRQALQDLGKKGLIADSGHKKWRSGQYEIL